MTYTELLILLIFHMFCRKDQLLEKNVKQSCHLEYWAMQSDGYSFCGDVVLDILNKASRDVDNIQDQIYQIRYVRIFIMVILILYKIIWNCILITTVALKLNFIEFLVVMCGISVYMHFLLSLKLAPHVFGLKWCHHPYICHVKAVRDDFSQKLFPSDCITMYNNWAI